MTYLEKTIAGLSVVKARMEFHRHASAKVVGNALELLKEQQQYKWTSVEERMPEKEGLYLVSAKHGDFHPWIAEMKIFMGIKGFCNDATMPVVGAWMPLPKPYGVQKDGEQE